MKRPFCGTPPFPVLRRTRLRTRLIAAFLLISVLPCLVLMLFSLRIYSGSIQKKLSSSSQQSMQLLNNNLTYLLEESSTFIGSLSVSNLVQDSMAGIAAPAALHGVFFNTSSPFSVRTNGRLKATIVIDADRNVIYNYGGAINTSSTSLAPILDATDESSPASFLGVYHPPYGDDCMTLCRKIYSMSNPGHAIGYIMLCLNPDVFSEQTFPASAISDDANIFLMNKDGRVILMQNDKAEEDPLISPDILTQILDDQLDEDVFTSADGKSLVIYTYNTAYHLYLVSLIPKDDIEQEINQVKHLIVLFSVAMMVVCYVLSSIVYRTVSDPVDRMMEACGHTGSDAPYIPIDDSAPDELGYLARAIDTMAEKNETMLRDLQANDMQKRDLELEMLQYQINPHFLFNTLNALKWIATINGVESLSSGISSLAGVLRNTLENKDELISLQQELSVLEDYCAIQNLRYTGQFNVRYQVDDDCLSWRIPRFLLQPLVENAILHGMRGNNTILNITVQCAFADSVLRISIRDDGIGFNIADAIDPETKQFSGIGLSNVDKRLQLFYGTAYRLVVQSEKNVGTTCQINIPLVHETDEKES